MQDLDVWRKAGKISADLQMHSQAITCYKEVQALSNQQPAASTEGAHRWHLGHQTWHVVTCFAILSSVCYICLVVNLDGAHDFCRCGPELKMPRKFVVHVQGHTVSVCSLDE